MHIRPIKLRSAFLTLAVTAVLAAAGQARADGPLPDCYVVAVGIDQYKPGSGLNNLKGCRNDATNLAARLKDQEGKLFGQVPAPAVLLDADATGAAVRSTLNQLRQRGKAGDWYVLVLSGHGGRKGQAWSFAPYDGNSVSDRFLLSWADALASQGKKVWIIVDACNSGQLRLNARELLERHRDSEGGGVLLMVASAPTQAGQCLGAFSSFAEAVNEALAGAADFDGDGLVTLRELRHYTYHRVYELIRQLHPGGESATHDCAVDSSLSMGDNLALAVAKLRVDLRIDAGLSTKDAPNLLRKGSVQRAYSVALQPGVRYTIDLKSTAFDVFLRLEDAEGHAVAENDDVGGVNRNARIVFTPKAGGTFRLVVTSYDSGTGPFTLAVTHRK